MELAVNGLEQVARLIVVAIDDIRVTRIAASSALVLGNEAMAGSNVLHVLDIFRRDANSRVVVGGCFHDR